LNPAAFDTPGDALPRPHGNCYWLLPGQLLAGEHPGLAGTSALDQRLRDFQAAGIQRFIDLTTPSDPVPAYSPRPVAGRLTVRESHPITDFGIPSLDQMAVIARRVEEALLSGERLYLHCKAGIGRTGTVAACLLVDHGFSAQQALALLQRKWQVMDKRHCEPFTPETDAQRAFVAAWAQSVASGPAPSGKPPSKAALA
jgi:hypothetical protein